MNIGVCGYLQKCYPCIQGAILKQIQIQKEQLVPLNFIFAPLKTIISSESPLENPDSLFSLGEEVFVDMESV
ncbi:hypothetical protein IJM86_00155 [bacterium]|nr:hypothetical protein [bacterium]